MERVSIVGARRAVCGALLAIFGCGGPRSRPITEFPNREALAAITAKPVTAARIDEGALPEQGWTVELGEAAWSADTPWQGRSAWDRAVVQALKTAGRAPRLTEAMSCVAREVGRWALDQPKAPPSGLRRFIIGACGVVAPDVELTNIGGDVPADASEEVIFQHWGNKVRELVAALPAAATDAGFAFVHAKGRAFAVLAHAQVLVELDRFSHHPSETGEVSFVGTVREPADFIGGYVNQGRYGVVPCDVDPAVPRPRFRLTCKLHGDDASAWIDLVYSPPRRVLAHTFARVLARRAETRQLRYQPARSAGERAATSADQFSQAAVTALNEVRAQAGLAPVHLNPAQSITATRMAPHYFSATQGQGSDDHQDTIALGLLAGWDVRGMIRDGGFISNMVPQTRDPARWLDETLETPLGRSALLADGIEEVALGPVLQDAPAAVGAIVTSYRFHRSNDHRADIQRLLIRAQRARKQRSLPPLKRLGGLDDVVRAELQKVHLGKAEPIDALQRVLESARDRLGIATRGYVVETTSLDALQIPEEVMIQPTLHLEIGVTHHKPKGAAWAQLVILVVFQDFGVVRI